MKTFILILFSVMFITGCSVKVDYERDCSKLSIEKLELMTSSFNTCVENTGKHYVCTTQTKSLFCPIREDKSQNY